MVIESEIYSLSFKCFGHPPTGGICREGSWTGVVEGRF